MSWQCFMLEPTSRARRALRRFTFGTDKPCPRSDYGHNASTPIEDGDVITAGDGTWRVEDNVPHDDPRWPTVCACGYAFTDDDRWQVHGEQLWRAPDGKAYTVVGWRDDGAPAGAMWDAPWHHDIADWVGPDGMSLNVMLPDGTPWFIDGPSRTGGHWTRTGTPPNVTARPSILSPHYHGWLTDGVLSDDLDGNLATMGRS